MLFSCLLLGTVYRYQYFDALRYGYLYRVKYNNVIDSYDVLLKVQYHFYLLMTATGMRLCKCLTESAPQLILQLYILVNVLKNEENVYSLSN